MGNTVLDNLQNEGEADPTKRKFRYSLTTNLMTAMYNMKPCEVGDNLGMLVEWMRQAEDKMSRCVRYMHTKQGVPLANVAKELGMNKKEAEALLSDRPEYSGSEEEEEEESEDEDESEEEEEYSDEEEYEDEEDDDDDDEDEDDEPEEEDDGKEENEKNSVPPPKKK